MDHAGTVKGGLDLYKKYNQPDNATTSKGNSLQGLSDFGSYGKSGSPSGTPDVGSLFG